MTGFSNYPSDPDDGGPCQGHCRHPKCRKLREDASQLCEECGKRIGFDTSFLIVYRQVKADNLNLYFDEEAIIHATCLNV